METITGTLQRIGDAIKVIPDIDQIAELNTQDQATQISKSNEISETEIPSANGHVAALIRNLRKTTVNVVANVLEGATYPTELSIVEIGGKKGTISNVTITEPINGAPGTISFTWTHRVGLDYSKITNYNSDGTAASA